MTGYAAVRRLLERIDGFIASFERSGRTPDRWECAHTISALINLSMNETVMAGWEMDLAETPHELRPPKGVSETSKVFEKCTAADLRVHFRRTRLDLTG